ncbi:MAG: pilus assembly protein N-terminal domain-containing protein [Selenomonadaceae bacterium]|nr:pilus assembly protein N-terminal domain-containing protein [Selenomonadaceae bacterium]
MQCVKLFLITMAMMLAALSTVCAGEADYETFDVQKCETIRLGFNTSKYFKLTSDIERIFIGSKIVTIKRLKPSLNEFVVTTLEKEGSTTLFVWTVDGVRHEYLINVTKDDLGLAEEIEQTIGLPGVHVKKIGNRILLTGTVNDQYERNYAIQVARLYVGSGSKSSLSFGSNADTSLSTQSSEEDHSNTILTQMDKVQDEGNVIDLLKMRNPLQIRLEAQVIEINSDKVKDLGIQYGESGEGGVFSIGERHDRTVTTTTTDYSTTDSLGNATSGTLTTKSGSHVEQFSRRPLKWMAQRFGPINATIHALVSNGKARILSRPSLTTLSGEQATIQIGGKIPYSVSNVTGTTVQFENYGIILQFKPIVDDQNRVVSTVHTEVSALSGQAVNGQPIISTRRADSVINLQSGSTMIIGGLMDSTESKAVSKIPLLGDIPVLGEFFKYTSKRRDKRELIILVTPYIVDDDDTSHVRMSDPMKDYYNRGRLEKNGLNEVDLNEPPTGGG